ncbi:MAG: sugar transferase, partial [Symploca sp. SIO2B6]|nr:sugar transferase [Symploca sp. SIO2B6]
METTPQVDSHKTRLLTSLDDVVLPETLPPLVLVAFTRPDLLQVVLESVRQQSLLPPKLIAFIDGARKPEDNQPIEQCIELLENFTSIVPVEIIKREQNLGCDQNIILGLTEVLSSHASLVYIEDDIHLNSCFYDRMCRLLDVYRDCKEVSSISSYSCPPPGFEGANNADFFVSNRIFSWGFAIWADRWNSSLLNDCMNQKNPFGEFYDIPTNAQTVMTLINQFWLEKNKKTDWVIAFTLAALYQKKVHIVPNFSFIRNIGFGHPEAKTYWGKEQDWVNARYDKDFCPNKLPTSLDRPEAIARPLSGTELLQHL